MSEGKEHSERVETPALDQVIGRKFPVLDDGFVRLIDYMGSDASIVQAARVSYGKGTKSVSDDRSLIRYLMRNQHTSPFEMCDVKLHVRVPMDIWRQWIRHRTASVNEYSTRYSIAIDNAKKTSPGDWRLQSEMNRQGSGDAIDEETGKRLTRRETEIQDLAREVYRERIELGVAREQARKDLPLSTYTEAYWKIDLHNLLHFLALRIDEKAQLEIREYATVIGSEIVRRWVPITWEAFVDYRLGAMVLSRIETEVIALINTGSRKTAMEYLFESGLLSEKDGQVKAGREANELAEKMAHMGMKAPWMEEGKGRKGGGKGK